MALNDPFSGHWDAERALDHLDRLGIEGSIDAELGALTASLQPATRQWFGKRLSSLWTLFMAARQADPRAMTAWMVETARLLSDLPFDVVGHAIDEAIRTARHNFIPSVGEIRAIADPIVRERRTHIERLHRMSAALRDPSRAGAREERREAQRRQDAAANVRTMVQATDRSFPSEVGRV